MGRYTGALHKLVEQGGQNKKGAWNNVLQYLELNAVTDARAWKPPFDSPLPPYTEASDELENELLDEQGPKKEETPLRISVRIAPSEIVAALCHVCPDAARCPDTKGRLPLHWVCRRPTSDSDSERVMQILIQTYPEALLHRDACGRTPLHYLFWYHASTRSAPLVQLFCQSFAPANFIGIKQPSGIDDDKHPLPQIPTPSELVPAIAAIICDNTLGCLPLHYAVMEGATREALKVLLLAHPHSKTATDRYGRTPLAWYLGAGDLGRHPKHVSGESPDPHATPIWECKRNSNIIHMLLNSKVARTADITGRYPLHWAAHLVARHFYSVEEPEYDDDDSHDNHDKADHYQQQQEPACLPIRCLQMLLDHHIEALLVKESEYGMTPLHLFFQVVLEVQELEWQRLQRNKSVRDDVDLVNGGPGGFQRIPVEYIKELLRTPDSDDKLPSHVADRAVCAAHIEDPEGRLPLHLALQTVASTQVIMTLVQAHPTALVHTTEENLWTPLHAALASPYTAPLQTLATIEALMNAYVTSRHGTFVNGKLALKMEDASGMYPLHLACQHQACLKVTQKLYDLYPRVAKFTNGQGDLPVHCLLDEDNLFGATTTQLVVGASLATPMGWLSATEEDFCRDHLHVLQKKIAFLLIPLDEECLTIASVAHGMLPLHIAVAYDACSYLELVRMIQMVPSTVTQMTTAKGHVYSSLDLHEMRKSACLDESKWRLVEQLLFAFGPTLESHRFKDDLLEDCVRIIRHEIDGPKSSAHMAALAEKATFDIRINETLSSIAAPEMDQAHKPIPTTPGRASRGSKEVRSRRRTNSNSNSNRRATPRTPIRSVLQTSKSNLEADNKKNAKKSIYDDDGDTGYVVSPASSTFDDDDDFASHGNDSVSDLDDDDEGKNDGFNEGDHDGDGKVTQDADAEAGGEENDEEQDVAFETPPPDVLQSPVSSKEERINGGLDEKVVLTLSPIALRLWTFFTLYNNPEDARDHYAKHVDMVLDELPYDIMEELVAHSIPEYATNYVEEWTDKDRIRDVANNNCKAIIHRAFYFCGRYEFRQSAAEPLLLHKTNDGTMVYVRALEYVVDTEEAIENDHDGADEEQIWNTGVAPRKMKDGLESVFHVTTRPVYIKFMKSQQAYSREVFSRQKMGINVEGFNSKKKYVVPLLNYFNCYGRERRLDRRYALDVRDDRFTMLNLGKGEIISLVDYPYAVVLPYRDGGDLFQYFLHNGRLERQEISSIGHQIGRAIQSMHGHGLLHGNISMHNIMQVKEDDDVEEYWALGDLTSTCEQSSETTCMAGIPSTGQPNFATGTFPPEMFVKLSNAETKTYNQYWEIVRDAGVDLDESVVSPQVDPFTGDSYVPRCYFEPDGSVELPALPNLPYKLVPAREPTDVWNFGQIMFTLCSSGHPMFATNMKTGHLLAYSVVANWDRAAASELVFMHIDDPLAQDLLLQLLSPYEERSVLTMEKVLSHPFFNAGTDDRHGTPIAKKIAEKRSIESTAYIRSLQKKNEKQAEDEWVTTRSKTVFCWDLSFQQRLYLSPSNLLRSIVPNKAIAPDIPFSALVLPYKLARSKSGKLTPASKKDVERAEKMGILLLSLSKICCFSVCVHKVVQSATSVRKWSCSDLWKELNLPQEEFSSIEDELVTLAAKEVEIFRENPTLVVQKMVVQRIKDLHECFDDADRSFLYLVDEFTGTPILTHGSVYPIEVKDKLSEVLLHTLPLMHCIALYCRGVSGSVSGLVRLIFEAAYPHVPPSWAAASAGLQNSLDWDAIVGEVRTVRSALGVYFGWSQLDDLDNLRFLQTYLEFCDPKNHYSDLQRVTNGEAALWTKNVENVEAMAKLHDFRSAYRADQETKSKLMQQDERIKELEKKLEDLKFRKEHNLDFAVDFVE